MIDPRRRAGAAITTVLWLGSMIGGGCALGFRNPDGPVTTAGGTGIARRAVGPAPPTVGDERLRAALNDARPYTNRASGTRNARLETEALRDAPAILDDEPPTTKTNDGERE